ncbi:MAG TPA: hypothetical protein PKI03_33365 [Pseudomonadota bacterium]|nr:hypothetical protein [Pseudomonadota bacterium]
MTTQVRALSMRDAYFLTYLAACIGLPLVVRGLLGFVSAKPGQDALAHALEFATKTLPLYDQKAQGTYRLLLETTTEYGLVIPAEPTTATAYESFLQTVRSVVSRAASAKQDPAVSAAYQAGTESGDMHLSLYVGRTLFYLRCSAPADTLLATAAGNVARTLFTAQKRLAEALHHPAWPAAVVEIGGTLEALFSSPPDAAQVQTSSTHAEYSEWERKVVPLLDELDATIARG